MQEEVGRAASGFVEALKGQPLSLALVAMNLLLIGFLYYSGIVAANERHKEMELLYENRRQVADYLFRCYPSPPESRPHQ